MFKSKKFLFALALIASIIAVPLSKVNAAATITVDSALGTAAADDGACTLREAITNANNDNQSGSTDCVAGSGADTIEFDIAGAGPHTITPDSALPVITEALTIDGTTDDEHDANGAVAPAAFDGVIMIEIDGTGAGTVNGFNVQADDVTIKGLAINGFEQDAINIDGADNIAITGNYIGTDPDGVSGVSNGGNGIAIFDSTIITIGGTDAADRNVIADNGDNGIYAQDATTETVTIQGNYIGMAADGTALGNTAHGVDLISGPIGVTIGGTATGAKNVLSNNGDDGVYMDNVDNNSVLGNYIGTNNTGLVDQGNTGSGIYLSQGSSSNAIGGSISGSRNVISGNDGEGGIYITDDSSDSNTIKGNYIGVGSDGETEVANTGPGISVYGGDSGTIGGATVLARNIISGNDSSGISLGNS